MKRFLALLLAVLLLPLSGAFCYAENKPDTSARLYYARTRLACKYFSDWETTNGINQIGVIPENVRVIRDERIHRHALQWLTIFVPDRPPERPVQREIQDRGM